MTPEQQIELTKAIGLLLPSLCWPGLLLFIILFFSTPLKKFLNSLSEISLKAVGVEATVKKQQQAEAASTLFADLESKIRANLESEAVISELKHIAATEAGKRAEEEVAKLLSTVADNTVETIRKENFLSIDSKPLLGDEGEVWELPYNQFATVSDLLDNIWFLLRPYGIPSMTYGVTWILRNAVSGKEYSNMGRRWARGLNDKLDNRSLSDVGLYPGMQLEIVKIARRS